MPSVPLPTLDAVRYKLRILCHINQLRNTGVVRRHDRCPVLNHYKNNGGSRQECEKWNELLHRFQTPYLLENNGIGSRSGQD